MKLIKDKIIVFVTTLNPLKFVPNKRSLIQISHYPPLEIRIKLKT
jgi:hypothetical protein